MRLFYVTMVFPAPSETFASNDVRALRKEGIDVSVHSLLSAHSDSKRLVQERTLSDVPMTFASFQHFFTILWLCLVRPKTLGRLLHGLFTHSWRVPMHLLKGLALAPRVLHVFSDIEKTRPDVVHIYWGHYPALVGYLVQHALPQTVVTISLAAYDLETNFGLTRPVAQNADAVRTLAHVNVDLIYKRYGVPRTNIIVIPDGVDLSNVGRAEQSDCRSLLDCKINKRFITAGRLTQRKGMYEVLEVFKNIFREHPDATLVFLGDGPERDELHARCEAFGAQGSVFFLGHVEHERVFAEMAKAEVFLFMSKGGGERLPNVVKEAMASECVCIATHTTGMEELIPTKEFGFVVPIEGVAQASAHALHVLSDEQMKTSVAKKAKAHIYNHFDHKHSIARYIDLWTKLASGKPLEPRHGA